MISPTQDSEDSRSRAHRAWWLGPPLFLLIALYFLPIAGAPPATNPNEVIRIELAASIAFLAQVDLGEAAVIYGLSEDVSIRDGEIYSDKAPGLSIISAPALWIVSPILPRSSLSDFPDFWPLRHALTLLLVALPTVGLAFLVGAVVPEVDPQQRTALAVIAALATPMWTYGTVFFGHAPAALLVTLAWFLLLGLPGRPFPMGPRRAALGGAAAGFAVATEYPTLILVAVIFVTLLVRRTTLPILASAVAGAIVGALPALIYHQIAFGAPWITGYSLKAHGEFQAIHARGFFGVSFPTIDSLWGILFGTRRGIFYYCPLVLLTPLGLWWLVRGRGWRDAGPIMTAILAHIFFAAGFVDWTAGWCAAARHLLPIIPLAAIVALYAATRLAKHLWGAVAVVILIAVSGTNAVLTIVLTPFFPPEFGAPLAQLVLPSLAVGAGFPNLLSSAFGIVPIVIVVLTGLTVIGALIWAINRLLTVRGSWLPAAFLTTVTALLLALTWQGSAPTGEIELMRAQVLRRLGHTTAADHIEALLEPAAPPARN